MSECVRSIVKPLPVKFAASRSQRCEQHLPPPVSFFESSIRSRKLSGVSHRTSLVWLLAPIPLAFSNFSRQQERKRRDFLCERRSRSRGGSGSCSTTSMAGPSNSLTSPRSRSSSARQSLGHSVASEMIGGDDSRGGEVEHENQEGDDEGPASSAKLSIARRVNARRPSTLTATEKAAPRPKRQETFGEAHDTASSGPFAADLLDDHNPETSISLPQKPRRHEHGQVPSSLGGAASSSNTAATREAATPNDFQPASQAASMAAITAAMKRPRTSGQVVAAAAAATATSSSRFLSPLLNESPLSSVGAFEGASVGSPPLELGSTASAAAVARASFVGGEGTVVFDPSAAIRLPRQHRRRYSSLSFAENPHATTAEMIRRYRGQLGRHSISSQQPRETTAAAATTTLTTNMPPAWPLSDRRRWSDASTPWHYYVSMNIAAGSGPAPRPRTSSVGGRRWSQHVPGRSRLAPSTRTAGDRWGAKHGRLEALVPGEEPAPPPASASILYRIPRESGPWVLDSSPSLELRRKSEQAYPSPYS